MQTCHRRDSTGLIKIEKKGQENLSKVVREKKNWAESDSPGRRVLPAPNSPHSAREELAWNWDKEHITNSP